MDFVTKDVLEYGVATLAVFALVVYAYVLLTFVRMWRSDKEKTSQQDERQTDLEDTLAKLAASAVNESSLTRQAYEKNSEVLAENTAAISKTADVIGGMAAFLKGMMSDFNTTLQQQTERVGKLETTLSDKLEQLSGQVGAMTSTKPIKVTVKDKDGKIIANIVAEEVAEDGSSLVVTLTTPEKTEKETKPDSKQGE